MDIRLGTIGSGAIVRAILDGVALTEGVSLAAVYSRSEETGRKLAEDYGCHVVYTDMEAFLTDDQVNYVYVASPNDLHYSYAKKALLAGKNVICEKPCTPTREEAEELLALAREKDLVFVDATPTAFLPNLKVLKEQLPKIGRIRLVMGNFSQYSSRYDAYRRGDIPNVFSLEHAGGALMDINYYNLYLNVALFGKPEKASYYPNLGFSGVDTSGILSMQYDGFVSTAIGGKDCRGENFFQIEGEDGYLYVAGSASTLPSVRLVTKTEDEIYNAQSNPVIWFHEVEEMMAILRSGHLERIEAGQQTMLDVVTVMEACRKDAGITFPGEME